MRKRLLINNLEECISFGFSFSQLAEFENESFKKENEYKDFKHDVYSFVFTGANVCANGTIYYHYNLILPF